MKKVFISYSHDSESLKEWVRKLASALNSGGIKTILDQEDLRLGELIETFQSDGIDGADRVLIICSNGYLEKVANESNTGAAQEKQIVSSRVREDPSTHKFIPILRDTEKVDLPPCLKGRLALDCREDSSFQENIQKLIREINQENT